MSVTLSVHDNVITCVLKPLHETLVFIILCCNVANSAAQLKQFHQLLHSYICCKNNVRMKTSFVALYNTDSVNKHIIISQYILSIPNEGKNHCSYM